MHTFCIKIEAIRFLLIIYSIGYWFVTYHLWCFIININKHVFCFILSILNEFTVVVQNIVSRVVVSDDYFLDMIFDYNKLSLSRVPDDIYQAYVIIIGTEWVYMSQKTHMWTCFTQTKIM